MKKLILKLIFLYFILNPLSLISQNSIYDFKNKTNSNEWTIINDDVMGGISKSNFLVNKKGFGVFEGRISTAYNGGFASVRYDCKRIYVNNRK